MHVQIQQPLSVNAVSSDIEKNYCLLRVLIKGPVHENVAMEGTANQCNVA